VCISGIVDKDKDVIGNLNVVLKPTANKKKCEINSKGIDRYIT